MDWSIAIFLTVIMSVMLFLIQRTEARRRLFVTLLMLVVGELIRRYVWYRDVHAEGQFALIVAVLFNFFFWILIGRYNPVGSSDRIRVLRMDD